jgi:hypothetical protein
MSKLTINDINQGIMFGQWTNDQIDSMIMAIKFARTQLGKRNKNQFTIGDTVQFHSRDGRTYRGTVHKVMVKNITVKTNLGMYKVPANMLEAA